MIPNTLHFIYGFKDNELKFYEFINIVLSSRILRPDQIIFHTATDLEGKWFSLLKDFIDNILTFHYSMIIQQISRKNKINIFIFS